jgi:hypothetical protein
MIEIDKEILEDVLSELSFGDDIEQDGETYKFLCCSPLENEGKYSVRDVYFEHKGKFYCFYAIGYHYGHNDFDHWVHDGLKEVEPIDILVAIIEYKNKLKGLIQSILDDDEDYFLDEIYKEYNIKIKT